jgi:hypothetical protein
MGGRSGGVVAGFDRLGFAVMTPKWPQTEVELAAPVVAWLEDLRWDVYQEVSAYGRTADIVAVQGPLIWVVEAKRSLSLAVLDQAWHWRTWAHYVSVAVPVSKRPISAFAGRCLAQEGIGLIKAKNPALTVWERPVIELMPAKLHRQIVEGLREKLDPAQKTYAQAGSRNGAWSPFKGTCDRLRHYVQAQPGATLKEAVGAIKTHYQTPGAARASLARWIHEGVVPGVRCERDGRVLRLYPAAVDSSVDTL